MGHLGKVVYLGAYRKLKSPKKAWVEKGEPVLAGDYAYDFYRD